MIPKSNFKYFQVLKGSEISSKGARTIETIDQDIRIEKVNKSLLKMLMIYIKFYKGTAVCLSENFPLIAPNTNPHRPANFCFGRRNYHSRPRA